MKKSIFDIIKNGLIVSCQAEGTDHLILLLIKNNIIIWEQFSKF